MFREFAETVLVHHMAAPQPYTRLLTLEEVVLHANWARFLVKCLAHVLMRVVLVCCDARIALLTVGEVTSTAFPTDTTLIAVEILLLKPVSIVQHTLFTEVLSERYAAPFALIRRL
jgi:hypothetical protein